MSMFFGFIIIFSTISFIILTGGSANIFLDIPSFVFILGLVIGSIISSLGLNGLKNISLEENRAKFFSVGKMSSLVSGMLGTVIGIVQMLQYLSDPALIGPAMAVSLLTFFYSCVLFLIFSVWEGNKIVGAKISNNGMMMMLLAFSINIFSISFMLFSFEMTIKT